MKKILFVIFLLGLSVNCTSSKWSVVDLDAIDERDLPVKKDSTFILVLAHEPTPENPVFSLKVQEIEELEFTQRVKVERTVQQYRPKWGFTLLGLTGAGITFYAGNTNSFIESRSTTQSIALNLTGAILTTLAITNLKPVGDPIQTGEMKFLRKNGVVMKTDTTDVKTPSEFTAEVNILYKDQELLSSDSYATESGEINIHSVNLLQDFAIRGPDPGSITVDIVFEQENYNYEIPVSSFLQPLLHITAPVAELRSGPTTENRSLLTEVGQGSELTFLDIHDEQWFEVQVGGTNSYITREEGEIRWHAVDNGTGPSVISVEDVSFGEMGVENSVPVLRQAGPSDRGFIISNHLNNKIGIRRYLQRDYQLVGLYFRNALGMNRDQVHQLNITKEDTQWSEIIDSSGLDSLSTVFVYIGGFATVDSSSSGETVKLIRMNEEDEIQTVPLEDILMKIAGIPLHKLIVFTDLEFRQINGREVVTGSVNSPVNVTWGQLANRITRVQPNSALVFSSGINQPTGIYSSNRFENMYHYIFPYYLAQGLQHRRTRIFDLVRYMENQVDYTSRRLFDRPQEVHAFGNLTIDVADDAPIQESH
ncbi:MAG: hypothetical protein WD510_02980 [Balneolaceae bacterium]